MASLSLPIVPSGGEMSKGRDGWFCDGGDCARLGLAAVVLVARDGCDDGSGVAWGSFLKVDEEAGGGASSNKLLASIPHKDTS